MEKSRVWAEGKDMEKRIGQKGKDVLTGREKKGLRADQWPGGILSKAVIPR